MTSPATHEIDHAFASRKTEHRPIRIGMNRASRRDDLIEERNQRYAFRYGRRIVESVGPWLDVGHSDPVTKNVAPREAVLTVSQEHAREHGTVVPCSSAIVAVWSRSVRCNRQSTTVSQWNQRTKLNDQKTSSIASRAHPTAIRSRPKWTQRVREPRLPRRYRHQIETGRR